jgi:hypothetical protein
MLFYSKNKQGQVSATMLHYRWPLLVMLYVMGMACAEAICHPPPVLFNNRISISEREIINQIAWPVPVSIPNDLIDEVTDPNFVNELDVISPAIDDYNPLSLEENRSGTKKFANTPMQ